MTIEPLATRAMLRRAFIGPVQHRYRARNGFVWLCKRLLDRCCKRPWFSSCSAHARSGCTLAGGGCTRGDSRHQRLRARCSIVTTDIPMCSGGMARCRDAKSCCLVLVLGRVERVAVLGQDCCGDDTAPRVRWEDLLAWVVFQGEDATVRAKGERCEIPR